MAYNSKLSTPQIEQALGAALLQEKGQYNITQDKGANYATLSEAIAAVSDDKYKVKGIVLTYNTGTEWVSKRYNGEDAGGFANEGNWVDTMPYIPKKLSEFSNDSGFITKTVENLSNYYLKNETYTRDEVANLIGGLSKIIIQPVDILPDSGDSNTIYLIPSETGNGIRDQYIYVNGEWKKIGDTTVNLADYLTSEKETDITNILAEGEIHKLQKNGQTIYPATTTDAVADALSKRSLSEFITINNLFKECYIHGSIIDDSKKYYISRIFHNDDTYGNGFMVSSDDGSGFAIVIGNIPFEKGLINKADSYTPPRYMIQAIVDFSLFPEGYTNVEFYLPKSFFIDKNLASLGVESFYNIPFWNNGLAMLSFKNLPFIYNTNRSKNPISPIDFSKFLKDIKFEGSPEDGYSYYLSRIQVNYAHGESYNFYITISKLKDDQSTVIGTLSCGATVPDLDTEYSVTLTSDATTVSKITILLNWKDLKLKDSGAYIENLNSYLFDTEYIFNPNIGKMYEADRLNNIETTAVSAKDSVDSMLSSDDKIIYQEEGEIEHFEEFNSGYSNYGVAQYTAKAKESYTFNIIKVGPVKTLYSSNDSDMFEYYIYIKEKEGLNNNNVPAGVPTSYSRFIAKGTIELNKTYAQYEIEVPFTIVDKDQVVVIYVYSKSCRAIFLGANSSSIPSYPDGPNNRVLFISASTDTPESESWLSGSTGFLAVAPILISRSPFVSKITLKEELNKALNESVPVMVKNEIIPDLKLTIPDVIPAVVDTELNIWNDTITLSEDNGLQSPKNYQVFWYCSKGYVIQRGFRFKPTSSDAGKEYSCKVSLYDNLNNIIVSKTFEIKVLAKNTIQSQKRVLYCGDSLGISTSNELQKNFSTYEGTKPIFIGTQGTSYKCEGYGGWKWDSFATEGISSFRIMISNISSMSVGSIYKDTATNNVFKVEEVNISEGTGNSLLSKYYNLDLGSYGDLTLPSGTLIKVRGDGDSNISYTGAYKESANPFWDDTTGALNIKKYRTNIGLQENEKIDLVSFLLGINGSAIIDTPDILVSQIKSVYDAFISDNPNCLFLIGLPPTCGNTIDGAGANYGATWDQFSYINNMQKIRLLYLSLIDRSDMPNLRIAPVHLWLDRYYGYRFSDLPISERCKETEKRHSNHVHPTTSGYQQLGDAWYASYIQYLSE